MWNMDVCGNTNQLTTKTQRHEEITKNSGFFVLPSCLRAVVIRMSAVSMAAVAVTSIGCSSTDKTPAGPNLSALPKPKLMMPESGQSTVHRAVSTVSDLKNKEPKASTFVALGSYRDQLAANPELAFAEAEQIRSQARQAYQEALKIDPKCTQAYIGLAKSFVAIEDAQQAFAMYSKALEAVPNDGALWYEKALTHARFKDFDGALTSMERCVQIDPDNRLYRRTMGLTLARAGRLEDATKTLKTCMKEEEVYFTMARMCQHLERDDLAKEFITMSLKAHPTYRPAHEMMASLNHPQNSGGIQTVDHKEPAGSRVHVGGIE
jgi:Flp pilus assembly protein TadD